MHTHNAKTLDIVALQLATTPRYQENLDVLVAYIHAHQDKHIILAPEVYLTGFDYDHMTTASKFSINALKTLKRLINHQILVLTLIMEEEEGFINQAVVIHQHKIIYKQEKSKLFALGDEHQHFIAGKSRKIKPFEIDGVSYAILICFELRFKTLWQQIEGADIVLIPSRWGKGRKTHLDILSTALAVMNQCYVALANASNEDMASSSALISPWGVVNKDDSKNIMRREFTYIT